MKKIIFALMVLITTISHAQILDMLKDKVKDKAADLVGGKLMNTLTTESITTNFKDCNTADTKPSEFGAKEKYTNLCSKTLTSEGYLLTPGYYEIDLKSFCLKAGTYAPSKGDGYLYAPLKGPKKEMIDKVVKNWYKNQDIEQNDVQALIWAILAKTSFKNMNMELKLVAAKLLSEKDILSLSKMGLDFLPDSVMSKAKSSLPTPAQKVLEAENKMRNFFSSSSSSSFAELESLAMLAGINPEKSSITHGTWGLHPNGYWMAFLPSGYSQMTIKIYVPETLKTVYFLPSEHVAVPANTSSQRLLVSDVLNCK